MKTQTGYKEGTIRRKRKEVGQKTRSTLLNRGEW